MQEQRIGKGLGHDASIVAAGIGCFDPGFNRAFVELQLTRVAEVYAG